MSAPGRRVAGTTAAVLLWFVGALPISRPAMAHGFGQRYDLPVPLWLYLYGAASAVLLSFVVFGLFAGGPRGYPRLNLLRFGLFRATLASRAFVFGLRVFSVAVFALVILTGLFGEQTPTRNLAPTVVWVIWWVGLGLSVALVGDLWALLNPLGVVFGWADGLVRRFGVALDGRAPYPSSWDVWPALALLFAFAWVELVFPGSTTPRNIASLALLYSGVTWAGNVYVWQGGLARAWRGFLCVLRHPLPVRPDRGTGAGRRTVRDLPGGRWGQLPRVLRPGGSG